MAGLSFEPYLWFVMATGMERFSRGVSDRYRIERELGAGGMATVYLAEDVKHGRKVAIKLLRPELAAVLGTDRFLKEIEITAGLRHPHILPLHDSGTVDGLLYYVMPFVNGQTLRARLDRLGRLPFDEAIAITSEVADALDYAHSQGIIHRDIKPENILLEGRHAVVADFGIARAVHVAGANRLTGTGMAVGTPHYMSPEQAGGEREVDARSDVYSLACVLYEMVTGKPPVDGNSHQEILAAKALGRVTPPRDLRTDVPELLSRHIKKGLDPDPTRRFTAAELRLKLRHADEDLKDIPNRRRRRGILAAIVVAAALVVLLGGRFYLNNQQQAWARTDGLAELEQLAFSMDEWDAMYRLGTRIASIIPNDTLFLKEWMDRTRVTSIRTDPPGARVYHRSYNDPDTTSLRLGETPLEDLRLPLWASRLRIELDGHRTQDLVVWTNPGSSSQLGGSLMADQTINLDSNGLIPANMVRVSGFSLPRRLLGLAQQTSVPDFLLDKFEVTNRDFKAFVDAGGYRTPEFWTEPFVKDGGLLSWEEAMRYFVDGTQRPGPSTWNAGSYPKGQDDHPVGGVSWFEAVAYARFAGKELPSFWHWRQALPVSFFHLVIPNSNIAETGGPVPIGSKKGIGAFGTFDQAGNVREWTYNQNGDERLIAGGAWFDPAYVARNRSSAPPWDRSAPNGFRLASYIGDTSAIGAARLAVQSVPGGRDYTTETPVGEQELRIYAGMYDYDASPLASRVEKVDSTRDWIREHVSFTAPYGTGERMSAYVYLPRHGEPPFQTVMYWPGDFVMFSGSVDGLPEGPHGFFVTAGRAVVLPAFNGTIDRDALFLGGSLEGAYLAKQGNAHRDLVIQWVKDFRRTVEYAVTRSDLDSTRMAYYGFSWGGRYWPIAAFVEPRIKAVITYVGGLNRFRTLPEVDQFNFLPYVDVPLKMIAGRYDDVFPYEIAAKPMFDLAGTPAELKEFYVHEGSHYIPVNVVARESLVWLDTHLGPVR